MRCPAHKKSGGCYTPGSLACKEVCQSLCGSNHGRSRRHAGCPGGHGHPREAKVCLEHHHRCEERPVRGSELRHVWKDSRGLLDSELGQILGKSCKRQQTAFVGSVVFQKFLLATGAVCLCGLVEICHSFEGMWLNIFPEGSPVGAVLGEAQGQGG